MKKILFSVLSVIISLLLLCSCGANTNAEQETEAITYAEICEANTYSALYSKHSSAFSRDNQLINGEFVEMDYYLSKTGYAFTTYPFADENGNNVQDLNYISDDGIYLYLMPMTSEVATYDILQYYTDSGLLTVEDVCAFGMVPPEYNQAITEYKKTEEGYEVTGENCSEEYVSLFYPAYFSDGKYAEGDKILFNFVLNENYEILKYENYYVFADGSEAVKTSYGEIVYDSEDCPDFMDNLNRILENDEKDISVMVYTENETIERKAYSDIFLLYTDYEVYTDAEYTNLLPADDGYYAFETIEDIAIYLKAPNN